jgi:hypothetical protein
MPKSLAISKAQPSGVLLVPKSAADPTPAGGCRFFRPPGRRIAHRRPPGAVFGWGMSDRGERPKRMGEALPRTGSRFIARRAAAKRRAAVGMGGGRAEAVRRVPTHSSGTSKPIIGRSQGAVTFRSIGNEADALISGQQPIHKNGIEGIASH